jgi:hypothetical protein
MALCFEYRRAMAAECRYGALRRASCRARARRIFDEFYADVEPCAQLHLERRMRERATSTSALPWRLI